MPARPRRAHNGGTSSRRPTTTVLTYSQNRLPLGMELEMSENVLLSRELRVLADHMATRYADVIPDYARLDPHQLRRDVAMVSFEFLTVLTQGRAQGVQPGSHLTHVALEAGRRRRQQSVSLNALLRAYRLWGQYTLEFLAREAPSSLVDLASEVASQVDIVSEASTRAYHMIAEPLPTGPIVGLAGPPTHLQATVLAPRFMMSAGPVRCDVEPTAFFLLLPATPDSVAPVARALADELDCVLVIQAGHGERLDELKNDLREAVGIAALLVLPPGVYDTRYLWLLNLGLSSPKYRDRFTRLLAPLEHRPELLQTLQTYLDLRLSPKATAETLGIHVNTVAYRLSKVQELMGCDLKQMTVRTTLHLAMVLHKAVG